jgi:hypothetical protein
MRARLAATARLRLRRSVVETWAFAAVALLAAACATKTPEGAVAPTQGEVAAPSGAAPCDQRGEARTRCVGAARATCSAQRRDCEAACETHVGPVNSERHPALQNDREAAQCRDGCGYTALGCERGLLAHCPSVCVSDAGALQPDDPGSDR